MPLFSFVIPVYNTEKYLRECIDSILVQSFTDYEIILIDDGSTDGSVSICDEYSAEYAFIRTIHKENDGQGEARNIGVKAAAGDCILFVDSDDTIAYGSLNAVANAVNNNKNVDIVFLECDKVFDNGNIIPLGDGINEETVHGKMRDEVVAELSELPKYPASPCTKAIRRELLLEKDIWFEKGLKNEDIDWTLKLLLAAQSFDYCGEKYYRYRQARSGSSSNTYSEKKSYDLLHIVEKWTGKDNLKTMSDIDAALICSYMAFEFPFLLIGYDMISLDQKKEYRLRVKACDWLLKHRNDSKTRAIRLCYTVFGIRITGWLLRQYLVWRNN